MSAENAWRIAREAAAEWHRLQGEEWAKAHPEVRQSIAEAWHNECAENLTLIPMPPAFAEAVRAEMEGLRAALKRAVENQKSLIWRLEELCNNIGPGDEEYDLREHVKECLAEDRALLSRLEGEGKR